MFGAGPVYDYLVDRLHDAGAPAPTYGRVNGEHHVWLQATLPDGTTERKGANLDAVASQILEFDMAASDRDQEASVEWLAAWSERRSRSRTEDALA